MAIYYQNQVRQFYYGGNELVSGTRDQGLIYYGDVEVNPGQPYTYINATGGNITFDGNFKIHTFTSSGDFTVISLGNEPTYGDIVDYLIVAGGGGGGSGLGGGGGAGGLLTSTGFTVTATTYATVVGNGGTKGVNDNMGTNGDNSSIFGLTAIGGGRGGAYNNSAGDSGGSGGGKGGRQPATFNNPGTPGQGNQGGANNTGTSRAGLGGGGAGAGAPNGDVPTGGNGGNGLQNSITGTATYYAGGGGGGNGGIGGLGGGSNGAEPPTDATPNTGGGGGGSGTGPAANGGSGIVIIRYKYQ
jgi:hypothetical protein